MLGLRFQFSAELGVEVFPSFDINRYCAGRRAAFFAGCLDLPSRGEVPSVKQILFAEHFWTILLTIRDYFHPILLCSFIVE